MDMEKFTQKSQEALAAAHQLALSRNHTELVGLHLFAALLAQRDGLVSALIEKAGAVPQAVNDAVEKELNDLPKIRNGSSQVYTSREIAQVLDAAQTEAGAVKDEYVSVEHLLLALLEHSGSVSRICRAAEVDRDTLMRALQEVRGNQRVTSQNPESTFQALEKYGRDLTELARQERLDPVIGRDDEIRRIIQILSRRTKNNPVLIG